MNPVILGLVILVVGDELIDKLRGKSTVVSQMITCVTLAVIGLSQTYFSAGR
jgi:hypothetical protein